MSDPHGPGALRDLLRRAFPAVCFAASRRGRAMRHRLCAQARRLQMARGQRLTRPGATYDTWVMPDVDHDAQQAVGAISGRFP